MSEITNSHAAESSADAARAEEVIENPAPEAAEALEPTQVEPEDADEGSGNKEAAKYRRKLREAERERDGLRATSEKLRSALLFATADLTIPGESGRYRLTRPLDLLELGGVDLDDLIDADGAVDAEKVASTLAVMHETRPGLFEHEPFARPIPGEGQPVGYAPARPAFQEAFTPPRQPSAGRDVSGDLIAELRGSGLIDGGELA